MDKTKEKAKKDNAIMKLLKVSEIRYHIGSTNLGPIDLQLRYGEEEYQFLLDSTILDKETNDKMLSYFNLK